MKDNRRHPHMTGAGFFCPTSRVGTVGFHPGKGTMDKFRLDNDLAV